MKENVKYIKIKNVFIDKDILTEYFCCDYEACKNRCCYVDKEDIDETTITYGAFLEESENSDLEDNYQDIAEYMTSDAKEVVDQNGVSVIIDDQYYTPMITRDKYLYCAYCQFSGEDICGCTIQKAGFKKPFVCSLFPIYMRELDHGYIRLDLYKADMCQAAFQKGQAEGISILQFCKDALIEKFGTEFYEKLESLAEESEIY